MGLRMKKRRGWLYVLTGVLAMVISLCGCGASQSETFNQENPDIKIEFINYEEDATSGTISRFYTDIMAGESPDLLMLPSQEIDLLSDSGALEDLNPYLDGDETLDRGDFLENILTAFEDSGHLYGMPITYDIMTMVGRTSVLENRSSWNLDDFIAYVESVPEEAEIFINPTKSAMLKLMKRAYAEELINIDYENSPEGMDSPVNHELLEKMLTFANRYEDTEVSFSGALHM